MFRFSEEMIRRAAGILATNATELQLREGGRGRGRGVGLYPAYSMMNHRYSAVQCSTVQYSMMNHSCVTNTKTIIDSADGGHLLTTLATRDITRGEQITNQVHNKHTVYR